ncbi:MAG: hypothetical protein M3463_04595, partial [Verrucomicrobiota bacterium]|nr:hypothetical protein [Verrucomicrobiota bacterium]
LEEKEAAPVEVLATEQAVAAPRAALRQAKAPWRTLLAVPLASALALAVHFLVSSKEPPMETESYSILLSIVLGAGIAAVAVQPFSPGLRRWMREMCP